MKANRITDHNYCNKTGILIRIRSCGSQLNAYPWSWLLTRDFARLCCNWRIQDIMSHN